MPKQLLIILEFLKTLQDNKYIACILIGFVLCGSITAPMTFLLYRDNKQKFDDLVVANERVYEWQQKAWNSQRDCLESFGEYVRLLKGIGVDISKDAHNSRVRVDGLKTKTD